MRSNKPIELLPLLLKGCQYSISSQELLGNCQLKDKWKPSFKNEDGDGSGMSFREYPTALQVWPSTWHQRDRERESDLEQLCGGQLR